ncbi:hypothetical protein E1176_02335 [Fulvivirga sp. RKSG066]|uniref:hypothetical protein n=1 Tax=Fulvivirga aurantia TaxID=2529383 RepID=UPI0012BCA6AA|nr:hypothetical protein [Fulvivirga aurantia]MTI19852.1 hypothetical protein [Fulvivirga aurantia]
MNKTILSLSGIFSGVLGVAISFLPQEIFSFYNEAPSTIGVLAIKLLGIALIALASVNWLSKDRLIGGIYNRPVALANAMHYSVGSVILLKTMALNSSTPLIVLSIIYGVFGVAFFKIMFTTPKQVAS